MRQCLALIVLLLLFTPACTMWSKPASGWSGATGGEQIERLFWKDVQAKDWSEVDRHLAATFSGVGPSGSLDRAGFLDELKKSAMGEFSLSECHSQINGGDTIVSCTMRAQRGGQPVASATLSVWQPLKKGWVMVAHSESRLAGS